VFPLVKVDKLIVAGETNFVKHSGPLYVGGVTSAGPQSLQESKGPADIIATVFI